MRRNERGTNGVGAESAAVLLPDGSMRIHIKSKQGWCATIGLPPYDLDAPRAKETVVAGV